MKYTLFTLFGVLGLCVVKAQNSMVGDGFGGRLWYKPFNYTTGSYSAYALCGSERKLYSWGDNSLGQLGTGNQLSTATPVEVVGMEQVAYFSTGYTMGAIKTDKTGWIWGSPDQFGPGSYLTPTKVIDSVKFVDAGIHSSIFVKVDGTVWSVGANTTGEFGDGMNSEPYSTVPKKMNNITNAVRTAQGELNSYVLLANGDVYGTGSNNSYGLGSLNTNLLTAVPLKIDSIPPMVDIKSCSFAAIGLTATGDVWMWGSLGVIFEQFKTPTKVAGLSKIVAISGCNDGFHFLALDSNHHCFGWGDNSAGQCGISGTPHISNPVKVADDVDDIMCGEWYSYIIKKDGTLWASGASGGSGSIWMELPNVARSEFTQIHPTLSSFGLCSIVVADSLSEFEPPAPVLDTPLVFFPNIFSPNSDGLNDQFRAILRNPDLVQNFDLKIYNRFGNLVFHTIHAQQGWNGYNSDLGTYFYYCNYVPKNKKPITLKGDFTLLR